MKAIVCIAQNQKDAFLLGWGADESQARRNAYAATHDGHNSLNEEFAGEELVPVSQRLQELRLRKDIYEIDLETGVFADAVDADAYMELIRALSSLCVINGELNYEINDDDLDLDAPYANASSPEFSMPPWTQTLERSSRIRSAERLLGSSLASAMESSIQINWMMHKEKVTQLAQFAVDHGLRVCVGNWTGLVQDCVSESDKKLEQIIFSFGLGMTVSNEEIDDYRSCV